MTKEFICVFVVVIAAIAMLLFSSIQKKSARLKYEAHDSVCSYCEHDHRYEKGVAEHACGTEDVFGNEVNAHIHSCEKCGEKYVCSFGTVLSNDIKQQFESGLRSR